MGKRDRVWRDKKRIWAQLLEDNKVELGSGQARRGSARKQTVIFPQYSPRNWEAEG